MILVVRNEPQATKSFLIQQFFKNVGEVWASSPHLRSKLKLHNERKQKSKRESEESQLPLKLKGCNERQGFRGNCDSQASWGCAPALPNQIGEVFLRELFSVTSRRQIKVFRCSSFSKMLPRCGRAAHICGANQILQSVFPAAIAFFETVKFAIL